MAVASGAATTERGGGGCSSMVSIVVAPAAMVGATRAAAAAGASSAVVVAAVVMVVVWCVLPRSIGHTAKRASVDGSGVITDRLYDKRGLSGSVWRRARPFGGRQGRRRVGTAARPITTPKKRGRSETSGGRRYRELQHRHRRVANPRLGGCADGRELRWVQTSSRWVQNKMRAAVFDPGLVWTENQRPT